MSGGGPVVKSQRPLDWLNFFLADVKDGLGPFLAIYLLSSRHWNPGEIGVVMMIAGIATVAARAPFGALIDWMRWKRALIVMPLLQLQSARLQCLCSQISGPLPPHRR
jgi:hypothetical protein